MRRPTHYDYIELASPQYVSSYDILNENSVRKHSHNDSIDMASRQCMSSYDLSDNNYLISPFNIYCIIWFHTILYKFWIFDMLSFKNILSHYVHWYRLPSLCVLELFTSSVLIAISTSQRFQWYKSGNLCLILKKHRKI